MAQSLLAKPKMFNHSRGLWGYTGTAPDGQALTVQSTGMGGPSAAIVAEELIALGARTLIRIGTCGALAEGFTLGELVFASEVLAADGATAALGAGPRLTPEPDLAAALDRAGLRAVCAVTTDLFYEPRDSVESEWRDDGAEVVEMEAAALLAVAQQRSVPAAVVLCVTDLLAGAGKRRISDDELEAAGVRLGEAGFAAFSP